MAKQITLCGKELKLAYSLHTAVSYEKMTGKSALDLKQFQPTDKDNPHSYPVAPLVELGYCMLLSCNDEKDIPSFEDLQRSVSTIDEMTSFLNAVSAELIAFYQPDKSADQAKTEDAGKNA